MAPKETEERDGVTLSNLDASLFDGSGVTKRDLVDYLDAVHGMIIPVLEQRPLSVVRVHRGQEAFMQKNLPKHAPDWIPTVSLWAGTSKREVAYALCDERRTLIWFANQRAVEYHPALVRAERLDHVTDLVLDLDPPEGAGFDVVVTVAHAEREALAAVARALAGRTAALLPDVATTAFVKDEREGKVFVDSTRVGGATVVAAYSPRVRPGAPVSFPVGWDDLDAVTPADFTLHTAMARLGERDPWAKQMPAPQSLSAALIEEGHAIPVARVQAMHEGKRRARARRG